MRLATSKKQKLSDFFFCFFFLKGVEGGGVGAGVALQKGKKGIEFIIKLAEIIVITILIKFNKKRPSQTLWLVKSKLQDIFSLIS